MCPYFFLQNEMDSPVGRLRLVASNTALYAVLWHDEKIVRSLQQILAGRVWQSEQGLFPVDLHGAWQILSQTESELNQYFQRQRRQFDVPTIFDAADCLFAEQVGTALQRQTWQMLRQIEYGQTWSYLQIATRLGRAQAVRAVAAAIGKNPLSIIVPCHRVIGSNGRLTGFAGGLQNKQKLLMLEQGSLNLL